MRKELLREMKLVAAEMPQLDYTVKEPHPYRGADLLLTGLSEFEGKPIDPNKLYTVMVPAKYPVNHYRRMRKIYNEKLKELGADEAYQAVKDYITTVAQIKQKQDEE